MKIEITLKNNLSQFEDQSVRENSFEKVNLEYKNMKILIQGY